MNWIREHKLIVGIIAAVVVLAVICCISFSRGGGSGIAGKGTNGAVSAGEGAVTGGMSKIESIFSGIFNYRSVVDENAALREEVAKLEQQLLDVAGAHILLFLCLRHLILLVKIDNQHPGRGVDYR